MVPFLQLYLNSINNTPCPRVYTLLRLCSSLCFATKGMSVVAATNVVVDTPPRNGGEEKEKFIGAPFPFSPSFIGRSPPPVFPFYSPDFRGRFVSLLDPISNLPLPVLGAAFLYCLVEISSILTRIDSTRERQRREKGGERSWDWYGARNYFDSR